MIGSRWLRLGPLQTAALQSRSAGEPNFLNRFTAEELRYGASSGIILATTVVALLVMTDGAWACRCMNRLINRCGHRRACCCICVQPTCCQPAAMPACCQPAAGEMKPGEGAVKVEAKVVPAGTNPDVMPPVPEVKSPCVLKPKPATRPEVKPEIKPEVKPEIKPGVKPLEVPAEPPCLRSRTSPPRNR